MIMAQPQAFRPLPVVIIGARIEGIVRPPNAANVEGLGNSLDQTEERHV